MALPLLRNLHSERPCPKCMGAQLSQFGEKMHDIECPDGGYNKNDRLYQSLLDIKNSCRAKKDLVVCYNSVGIYFFNKESQLGWYFEGLSGSGWNTLSRSDLRGRKIYIYDFLIDINDNEFGGDLWCIEWMYRVYGSGNVHIERMGSPPAELGYSKIGKLHATYLL